MIKGNRASIIFQSLLLLLLGFSSLYRANLVQSMMLPLFDCTNCFMLRTVQHDALILAFLLLICFAAARVKSRSMSFALRSSFVIGSLVYVADVLVFKLFSTRLLFEDFLKFASDSSLAKTLSSELFLSPEFWIFSLALLSGLVVVAGYIASQFSRSGRGHVWMVGVAGLLLGLYMTRPEASFSHSWGYHNLVEIHRDNGVGTAYSDRFLNKLFDDEQKSNDKYHCDQGLAKAPDIILLSIESLSPYQSKYFSGLNDFTPQLDRIAEVHSNTINFFANGFTTEGGLIAMLLGEHPIPSVAEISSGAQYFFSGFYNRSDSLPATLNKSGYQTAFLTAGNLGFSNKGAWLKSIGFSHIEGHDQPYYNGWPRYAFNAPPDEALFSRAVQFLDARERSRPLFLFLENVSTHMPYIDPVSNTLSLEATFGYTDKMVGLLYKVLRRKGFFENGILIITSDHRSMTPVDAQEYQLLGESTASRIPFIFVSERYDLEFPSEKRFQQADLKNSILYLATEESCHDKWRGNMFMQPAEEAECVLHARGDRRSHVDAFCGNDHGVVKLNGDNTGVISGQVPAEDELLEMINKVRVLRSGFSMADDR